MPNKFSILAKSAFVRLAQPSNAELPIEETPLPIVTEVSPVQSLKAEPPIDVTLSPIVTDMSLVFP